MPRSLMRRYYFPAASLTLLALTLIAFGDNLFTDVGQPSNHDPKFIVHGLLCGAWIIVLFTQSTLIAAGNVRLHRKLGIAAIAIAVGVTLSTIWVFVAVWKGWAEMNPEVKANRLLLPSYSVAVAMGYLQRRRPDRHKRLIYAGTLFMLEPVLSRVYDPLVVPLLKDLPTAQVDALFLPWLFCVWLAFFVSWLVYDWRTIRRIHAITIGALAWLRWCGLLPRARRGRPGMSARPLPIRK